MHDAVRFWQLTTMILQVSVQGAMAPVWAGVAALGLVDQALGPLLEQLLPSVVTPLLQGSRCCVSHGAMHKAHLVRFISHTPLQMVGCMPSRWRQAMGQRSKTRLLHVCHTAGTPSWAATQRAPPP